MRLILYESGRASGLGERNDNDDDKVNEVKLEDEGETETPEVKEVRGMEGEIR